MVFVLAFVCTKITETANFLYYMALHLNFKPWRWGESNPLAKVRSLGLVPTNTPTLGSVGVKNDINRN